MVSQIAETHNICQKCILSDGFLGINLNSDGICNFCVDSSHKNPNWSKVIINSNLKDKYLKDWNRVVKEMQKNHGKQNFDCVLGYSGGKDSTALLDYLITDCNLTPLAITIDTGFMTDIAKENIRKTLRKINYEKNHLFIEHAIDTFTKLYKWHFLHHISNEICLTVNVCDACSDLIHSIIIKEAIKRSISYVIFGYSPDQIKRYFYEIPQKEALNDWIQKSFNGNHFNDYDQAWFIDNTKYNLEDIPRILLPYHVINYDENQIIAKVESKALIEKGNADPIKTNCFVVSAALFYDANRYGGVPYALQYAELVRQNPKDRSKWLRTVKMLSPLILSGKFNEHGIKEVLKKIGFSKKELLAKIQELRDCDPQKESIIKNINIINSKKLK